MLQHAALEAVRVLLNKNFHDVPTLDSVIAGQGAALGFMGLCLALASAGGVGGGPMLVSAGVAANAVLFPPDFANCS